MSVIIKFLIPLTRFPTDCTLFMIFVDQEDTCCNKGSFKPSSWPFECLLELRSIEKERKILFLQINNSI